MDWANERYVRAYTRDSGDWLALSWDAQSLFLQLLRKVDRGGILELGKQGMKTVAVVLHQVSIWESRISPALDELLADGCVIARPGVLLIPNFELAQETPQSDKQRQAESRARRRDQARRAEIVTDGDSDVTNRDSSVTPGHAESRRVTPDQAEPSGPDQAKLSQAEPSEPSRPRSKKHAVLSKHREAAEQLWGRQELLRRETIPGSRRLEATDDRLLRIAELLEAGASADDCLHVLQVHAGDCRRNPDQREWFNGDTNWRKTNFDRALGRPAPKPAAAAANGPSLLTRYASGELP
jgi:hypothetical protein